MTTSVRLAGLLAATLPLIAADLYVAPPPTGNDTTGNGSSGSPWATMGKAAASVSPGDTVYVAAGTYQENVTLTVDGTSDNRITWIGERSGDDWLTIIDPSHAVSSSGWTQATGEFTGGNLVWKKTLANLPVEPTSVFVDGHQLMGWSHHSYVTGWYEWTYIGLPADSQYTRDGWTYYGSGLFWDGVEAAFAWRTNTQTLYVRFRNGESPATKSNVRVSTSGPQAVAYQRLTLAPIRILADYNTIRGFHVRGSHIPILINGTDGNGTGAKGTIVEQCFVRHGIAGIYVFRGSGGTQEFADNIIIRSNLITGTLHGMTAGHLRSEWSDREPQTWPQFRYYYFGKYQWGASSESGGITFGRPQRNATITGNTITNAGAGIQFFLDDNNPKNVWGVSGSVIAFNTIQDTTMSGIGLSAGQGEMIVASNLIERAKYPLRLQYFNIEVNHAGAYHLFENKIYKSHAGGQGLYLHAWPRKKLVNIGNPPTAPASRQALWFYHNSISGGDIGMYWSAEFNDLGLPKFYMINNIFSTTNAIDRTASTDLSTGSGTWYWPPGHIGALDHNAWIGRSRSLVIADAGPNNVTLAGREWTLGQATDFAIASTSAARDKAIDISRPFTVNSVNHAALPGYATNYFTGLAPDIGAWQYGVTNTVTPPSTPDTPRVSVAVDPVFISEISATTFTFTRSESLTGALTVNFTVGGTAAGGTDYQNDLGTSVVIADGQATATKTLTGVRNTEYTGNQSVTLTISDSEDYIRQSPFAATAVIVESDVPPTSTIREQPEPGHSPLTRTRRL